MLVYQRVTTLIPPQIHMPTNFTICGAISHLAEHLHMFRKDLGRSNPNLQKKMVEVESPPKKTGSQKPIK
jgi:hypothetical protein